MARKKLRRECHDEGDQTDEAADQQKESVRSTVACSATTVDRTSPALDERPSSGLSHLENERDYLPVLAGRIGAEPTLVGSHPGLTWRHIPGCTAHTRMLAVVGNTVPDPALALRMPCLGRRILRLRLYCDACLCRDLSFC